MFRVERTNGKVPGHSKKQRPRFDEKFMGWSPGLTQGKGHQPAVNIKETPDQFILEMAAPGLNKEDFQISIHQNQLNIEVDRSSNQQSEEEVAYLKKEFNHQSFSRSFDIPKTADTNNIGASYVDGILSVTIPKRDEYRSQPPRNIEIE